MYSLPKNVYRERIDFSKIKTTVPIPNLIEIQKKSYERFLQMNRLPNEREDIGLQSVFKSVFPISDFRENSSLEFIEYSIGNWECKCGKLQGLQHLRKPCANCGAMLVAGSVRGPRRALPAAAARSNEARGDVCDICGTTVGLKLKYDVDECQERGMTYAVPLKVTIRLVVWNKDPETGAKTIRDIKEQEVYFGDIPLMTDNGTFIINGTERVIVSQLHRSPGAFFHSEDKTLYVAQVIPYRGSWVEFEYDAKNLLYVRIDRKRKFLALGVPAGPRAARRRRDRPDLLHGGPASTSGRAPSTGASPRAWWACAPARTSPIPGTETVIAKGRKLTHVGREGPAQPPASRPSRSTRPSARARSPPPTSSTRRPARSSSRPTTRSRTASSAIAQEKGVDRIDVFFPERDEVGPTISATLQEGPGPHARRGAHRDLPPPAARAIRRRSTARGRSSRTCSSTRRSTTSRGSAA